MKRTSLFWLLALLAIGCLAARPAPGQEPGEEDDDAPVAEGTDAEEYGEEQYGEDQRGREEDEYDEYEACEIRAYRVADLLIPALDYPYGGGLPTLGPQGSQSLLFGGMGAGRAGMQGWAPVGMGGTGGGGFGGGTGGGFFQVQTNTQPGGLGGVGGMAVEGSRESGGQPGGRFESRPPLFRNVEDLIETIKTIVGPDTWDDVGGWGAISYFSGLLLIRQLPENHEEIDELLETIRSQGGTAQTAIVDAHWLLLDSAELGQLVPPNPSPARGTSRLTVDQAALNKLAGQVPGYRGRLTCFSGQTVHLASGSRRALVTSAIPVVGSGVGYQPVLAVPNVGVVLQVTPSLLPGMEAAILDVQSTVTGWNEPEQLPFVGSDSPPTAKLEGHMGAQTLTQEPGGSPSVTIDRADVPTHQLAATLRVPLGEPVLVGGLTLQPTEGEADAAADEERKQLYLIVRVGAAAEGQPPKPAAGEMRARFGGGGFGAGGFRPRGQGQPPKPGTVEAPTPRKKPATR
jgi:hypothetical protein